MSIVPSLTLEERFWSKFDQKGEDECWPWTRHRGYYGHGIFYVGKKDGRSYSTGAHRVAWFLEYSEWPVAVCHNCDNPPCVNVKHLFKGTQADNVRDMFQKRRNVNRGHPGEYHPMRKLDLAQVVEIRRLADAGVVRRDLASRFEVSYTQIGKIVRGEQWRKN